MQFDCDIDTVVAMVGRHVSEGWYRIVSISATMNMLVVVCGMERMWADLPEGFFRVEGEGGGDQEEVVGGEEDWDLVPKGQGEGVSEKMEVAG